MMSDLGSTRLLKRQIDRDQNHGLLVLLGATNIVKIGPSLLPLL